jgi:hypothetical protein
MPPTPEHLRNAYQHAFLLPGGGTWFDTPEEAAAHPGTAYVARVREGALGFFGAYPSATEYVRHAPDYLELRALRTAADTAMLRHHSPPDYEIPFHKVEELGLPHRGRWFLSECGARAALARQDTPAIIESICLEVDSNHCLWCLYPGDSAFIEDILATWPDAAIDPPADPLPADSHVVP